MSVTPQPLSARRWSTALATAVLIALATLLGAASGARAAAPVGTYTVVSCTQPDGSPAPTDGWRAGVYGAGLDTSGSAVNTCGTGGDLTATSSSSGSPEIGTGPEWTFTAPAGATIAGGFIDAALTAPQGQAWLATPLGTNDAGDTLAACAVGLACGTTGATSGAFAIVHPGGTSIYAPAICIDPGQAACPAGGGVGGVNAEVAIHEAEIELAVVASPAGHDFSGSLLTAKASGQARLSFAATDPMAGGGSGPGIYTVTVAVDGTQVLSTTPNTNGGKCVALGTDAGDGAPIFANTQPCKASERVTVPVDTAALPDGSHTLTVSVTDAAGDVATVLTRRFTTSNPVTTPTPTSPHEVSGHFVLGWRWDGATTTLVSAGADDLPAGGTVAVQCDGSGCPALHPAEVPVAQISTLLTLLRRSTFHAGDRVYVTLAPPAPPPVTKHRRHAKRTATLTDEHLRLTIRRGARPTGRLVGSVPSAG